MNVRKVVRKHGLGLPELLVQHHSSLGQLPIFPLARIVALTSSGTFKVKSSQQKSSQHIYCLIQFCAREGDLLLQLFRETFVLNLVYMMRRKGLYVCEGGEGGSVAGETPSVQDKKTALVFIK